MIYNDIMTSDNFDIDYYKGWLIVYDKNIKKNYPVQLKDTKTNRNITRKQFKQAVNNYGFDKACNSFKKLYAKYEV
jgi:ubiquitin